MARTTAKCPLCGKLLWIGKGRRKFCHHCRRYKETRIALRIVAKT
jgi:hypothetical protein